MRDDRAYEMAQLCIAAHLSPTEYKKMTIRERGAFVEVLNEIHESR